MLITFISTFQRDDGATESESMFISESIPFIQLRSYSYPMNHKKTYVREDIMIVFYFHPF